MLLSLDLTYKIYKSEKIKLKVQLASSPVKNEIRERRNKNSPKTSASRIKIGFRGDFSHPNFSGREKSAKNCFAEIFEKFISISG
jgi:hypothetical protein